MHVEMDGHVDLVKKISQRAIRLLLERVENWDFIIIKNVLKEVVILEHRRILLFNYKGNMVNYNKYLLLLKDMVNGALVPMVIIQHLDDFFFLISFFFSLY